MPLNKVTLKSQIKNLCAEMRTKTEVSDEAYAEKMATIIDDYIKTATITVAGVITAGSAATQTQTAPVTATIS